MSVAEHTYIDDKLTSEVYWENVWSNLKPPLVAKISPDMDRILGQFLPRKENYSLLEIGCAPGRYLVYFHNRFGYHMNGIEYVDSAAELTRENMEYFGIKANIIQRDIFNCKPADYSMDIVFSAGFIEHFRNSEEIINLISSFSKDFVISIVPNLCGINGFISKTIRPSVYKGHKKINKAMLQQFHENAGLQTLFCDYVGALQFIRVAGYNQFFTKHKTLSLLINIPFGAFNWLSTTLSRLLGYYPRTPILSRIIMYVGRKNR